MTLYSMHGDSNREWGMLFSRAECSGCKSSLCVQTTHTCTIYCEAISTSQLYRAPGNMGSCTSNVQGSLSCRLPYLGSLEPVWSRHKKSVSDGLNVALNGQSYIDQAKGEEFLSWVAISGTKGRLRRSTDEHSVLTAFPAILFPAHLTVSDKVCLQ